MCYDVYWETDRCLHIGSTYSIILTKYLSFVTYYYEWHVKIQKLGSDIDNIIIYSNGLIGEEYMKNMISKYAKKLGPNILIDRLFLLNNYNNYNDIEVIDEILYTKMYNSLSV